MTLLPIDRTGAQPGYLLEQPAMTFEEAIFPFTQLGTDPQGRVISWLAPLEGGRLSITCKRAYAVWQGMVLAGEEGAAWFVDRLLEHTRGNFDEAARCIQRRVALIAENTADTRFQGLFTSLIGRLGYFGRFHISQSGLEQYVFKAFGSSKWKRYMHS